MNCYNKIIELEKMTNENISIALDTKFDIGKDKIFIKPAGPAGLDTEKVYQVQNEQNKINLSFNNFCEFIKENYSIIIVVLIILLIIK